jgi:hypothetical protein
MEAQQLRAILKRAKLKLICGNGMKVDNNHGANSAKSLKSNISYQTLPSSQQITGNSTNVKPATLSDTNSNPAPGTPPAILRTVADDSAKVTPISNAVEITAGSIDDGTSLEVYRLRRREKELESIIADKNERLVAAQQMLADELIFWRTGLNDHVWETLGTVLRRVTRIEGTIERITSKHSKFYPPLELPAAWKKK